MTPILRGFSESGKERRQPLALPSDWVPEARNQLDDRQLDALLERLDRLCDEIHTLNRRTDTADGLQRIAHELTTLNDSLQALAYAALGNPGPQVRRRRSA